MIRSRPTTAVAHALPGRLTGLLLGVLLSAAGVLAAHRPANAQPPASADEEFAAARHDYQTGQYRRAIRKLRPLLSPSIRLAGEEQVVEALKILGISLFLEGKRELAEGEFTRLLAMRPDIRLDPLTEPPSVVAFFDEIKRKMEGKLAEIRHQEQLARERREREEAARRLAAREKVYIERRVRQSSFALTLVPFGVGQFQNGQAGKGVALLVTESVLAISSIALWSVFQYRFPGGRVTPAHEEQANWLRWSHVGTGAAFFAVALCGMIDAMVNFRREEVIERELPGRPAAPRGAIPGAAPQAPPAGPRSSRWQTPGRRPRVGVSPAAGPGFLGASLGGTF